MPKKLVRFDWAMKNILRQKSNFGILEDFISQLLKTEIKIKNLLESESNKDTKTDKTNRVDILAQTSTGEKIIIEVQCNSEWDYISRILYAVSKAVVQYINQGQKYKEISKIISISIVFFDLGQGKDYIYHGTTQFLGLYKHDTLKLGKHEIEMYKTTTDQISKILPEYYILKVNNFSQKDIRDTLDEWMYFLKNEDVKDTFKSKGLQEAHKKLQIMKLPDYERQAYDKYMEEMSLQASLAESKNVENRVNLREAEQRGIEIGQQQGIEIGEQRGIEIGKHEQALQIAKKLLSKGKTIQEISDITDLPKEEIEKIVD